MCRLIRGEKHNKIFICFFFFQAEDGIRDSPVTGVQTCALPIYNASSAVLSLPGGTTSLTDVSVLFSAFSTTHGAGADFSNAGMVELAVSPANAATDILVEIGRASCRERV